MTDTPLLDELEALGPAGARLLAACEQLVEQAHAERGARAREQRRELLDERVASFFAENPAASANAACGALPGFARQDILRAVRAYKRSVLAGANHSQEAA